MPSAYTNALAILFRRVKPDTTQQVVQHLLRGVLYVRAGLDIFIQPQTAKKQQKHEKAGITEYDNPKDSTSEYWNPNWIAG